MVSYRPPTRDDVAAAARRLAPLAWRTPFAPSSWLSDLARADVRLKLESVQRTGSFKIRGAANAIAKLSETRPDVTDIVTASAGNHGQAVALAAARAGLRAHVFVPETAPAAKIGALRRFGAEVNLARTYDEAEALARTAVAAGQGFYVSPYNDPDVIAGAGTTALEMFEEVPDLDLVIAPLGGGGLLAGCAIVAKSQGRAVEVIGAEAEASPVFTAALRAQAIVPVEVSPTLADGLAGNLEPGSQTFDLVRASVDRVVLAREPAIFRAMQDLIRNERLIAEGAGAAGIAAILDGRIDLAGRRVGVVVSGRNVDASVLARLMSAGSV